MKPAAE